MSAATKNKKGAKKRSKVPAMTALGALLVGVAAVGAWLTSGISIGHTGPVTARVVNTWDNQSQKFIGVNQYPDALSDAGAQSGYSEGETVTVTCQILNGRTITDSVYKNRPLSSSRWDQLANGKVILDMYTDLPKPDGRAAPGLAECGGG